MAEAPKQKPAKTESHQLRLKLMPANQSEQPILANTTLVTPASGFVYVDFGFIEPGVMPALGELARQGNKLPEEINGRLAARVALAFDTVQQLHQQLGGILQGLQRAQAPAPATAPATTGKKN